MNINNFLPYPLYSKEYQEYIRRPLYEIEDYDMTTFTVHDEVLMKVTQRGKL